MFFVEVLKGGFWTIAGQYADRTAAEWAARLLRCAGEQARVTQK